MGRQTTALIIQRLERVERDLRRWKRLGISLAVSSVVAVVAMAAQGDSSYKAISTRGLKIIDKDGGL